MLSPMHKKQVFARKLAIFSNMALYGYNKNGSKCKGGDKMGLIAMLKGEEPNPIELLLNYKDVGQYGEYLTEYALGKDNLPGYRKTICNVYIPHKGKTTEIDVVMVHEKGIFILESKNYSGWIFGSAEQHKWTQSLQNGEKHQFYNPIKQNATHCKAIESFLDINAANIFSYIVFSKRCVLKKVPENTASYTILRRNALLRELRKDIDGKPVVFSPEQIELFSTALENAANVTAEQKQAHIEAIHEKANGTICPYCNTQLIKRNGKYGAFWGCSNYPKCRFVQKIEK